VSASVWVMDTGAWPHCGLLATGGNRAAIKLVKIQYPARPRSMGAAKFFSFSAGGGQTKNLDTNLRLSD
jgi:hypothetical protein